jgi:hypothetical protein
MLKYQVFREDEPVAEYADAMSLYKYLKEHIKGPDKLTPMSLAKELAKPGKVYFRDREDQKYIILIIPEETK